MADGYLHIDVKELSRAKFDRKTVRKAFVKIGQAHLQDSRRLIASHNGSKPGKNPGTVTGLLSLSIGYYVPPPRANKPGFMVRIAPNQKRGRGRTASILQPFYPAFLLHGVKQGAKRQKKHHKGAAGGSGWRLAPRNNYMIEALRRRTPWTRYVLTQTLRRAITTEKVTK